MSKFKNDLLLTTDRSTIVEPGHLRVSKHFWWKLLEVALIEFLTRQFLIQEPASSGIAYHLRDWPQFIYCLSFLSVSSSFFYSRRRLRPPGSRSESEFALDSTYCQRLYRQHQTRTRQLAQEGEGAN